MAIKSNLLLVAAFLFLAYPKATVSQARQIDPEKQRQIDEYIQNTFLPGSGISSMGLSIVQNDGEILYTTGYGKSDIERNIETGNETQFLLGSVTKSFTAVVAVKVLHEHFPSMEEAVLDTPIRQLVPHFNFTLNDRFRSEHMTTRDLLAHRVCTSRDDVILFAVPFATARETVYQQRYTKEICGVRSEFQYNNQMYGYIAELISFLEEKSFEDVVENFLKELGMPNSVFVRESDDYSQLPNRAKPYYVVKGVPHPMNTDLLKRLVHANSAGGLFVTPNDMSKYMRFHLNLGSLDGRQIVPENVMKWLTKPANLFTEALSYKKSDNDAVLSGFGYGLGLFLASYDGWEYIMHGGDYPPYHSLFSMYPTQKLSIYSNVNMAPVGMNRFFLHATLFEILKGTENVSKKTEKLARQLNREKEEEAKLLQQQFQSAFQEHVEKAKVGTRRVDISGVYGSGSLGEINVTERFNEQLNQTQFYMSYGQWYSGWLEDVYEGIAYKLHMDTDVVQDDYAVGATEKIGHAMIYDDTFHLLKILGETSLHQGSFKLGVRLDQLPVIPWAPDSC